ncbi:uncharacterized protein LOC115329269 [Ixodes scapularis]|uniref:uncharacterized protein LOC115329269 n=1 Tax=Ixodes scapularis TaxID=6945 RepID=UPI001A9D95D7|nr:uncharacterized protein LOC115329269 [Ixodes scapularis]
MSLKVIADAHAKSNSNIKIIELRELSAKGSAHLELYFLFSREHKNRVENERVYLEEFVERINDIFWTRKDILYVTFIFLQASVWNPGKQAQTATGSLNAEVLKRLLKEQVAKVEKKWKKTHPHEPISAAIFVTTQEIGSETANLPTGISGQIGGICVPGEKVAAVTDDGNYSGVRAAAVQLSLLMGAVYDGQRPPRTDLVRGGDGAAHCKPEEGFLMGQWGDRKKSFRLSTCTPNQHIFVLRHRGPECYGTSEEKAKMLKTTK